MNETFNDIAMARSDDENCTTALLKFIEHAKRSPALRGIVWESVEWKIDSQDAVAQRIKRHRSYRATLTFTNRATSSMGMSRRSVQDRTPLDSGYRDFAKSDVRLAAEARNVGLDALRRRLTAHQFLEAVLTRSDRVSVATVTPEHFRIAERLMVEQLKESTAYKVAQSLEQIGKVLDKRRLCETVIDFQTSLTRPRGHDILTEVGQTAGLAKMVSDEALNALAEISASPKNEEELFFIRIIDLLVCTGFRIGEALTLPKDCWVEEPRPAALRSLAASGKRCGILYFAEKVMDYRVKWLDDHAVDLARRAIDDLTRLGAAMRATAAWMDKNPGRLIVFANQSPDSLVDARQACQMMGLHPGQWTAWRGFRSLVGRRMHLLVGGVEREYLSDWRDGVVLSTPSGRRQLLSETLIVAWENQFHGNRSALTWLPRTITESMFADRIAPASSKGPNARGLLTRFALRVTSHQFRHWLNTIAANEGLSDIHLAKWMGRKNIAQNQAYKHGTLAMRTAAARKLILEGEAHGAVARIVATLPLAERDAYLAAAVETAHATEFGLCVHNFSAAPCPNHLQCLRKCGDYLRVKGDAEQRDALLRLKEIELANKKRAQLALTDGYDGADSWLKNSNELLEGIDEALAVDDVSGSELGAETRVFRESSKLDPIL